MAKPSLETCETRATLSLTFKGFKIKLRDSGNFV